MEWSDLLSLSGSVLDAPMAASLQPFDFNLFCSSLFFIFLNNSWILLLVVPLDSCPVVSHSGVFLFCKGMWHLTFPFYLIKSLAFWNLALEAARK